MSITFTTTATNRPEVLDRTYASFNSNITGIRLKDCELVINVDPLPSSEKREEAVDIAKKYFGKVTASLPEKPNFTTAINTIWSLSSAAFIFNLEDDWLLTKPVNLDVIMQSMKKNPNCLQCVLRAYNYDYNKMALSPSIIKRKLYSQIAGKLDSSLNPEIQLRDTRITKYELNKKSIMVHGNKPIVRDIGREWIEKSGFKRPDKKAHFNAWVKK